MNAEWGERDAVPAEPGWGHGPLSPSADRPRVGSGLPPRSARLGMAPSLLHTRTRSRSHYRPPRPGPRETAPGGEPPGGGGGGRPGKPTDRARPTGGWCYLCQGELGRRSHGVSIMHGRGRKDGRTGVWGGEEAEGAAGGEARAGGRAGWRASPRTSTTSLLSPAPPAPRRPRWYPNPGAGFFSRWAGA